MQGIFCSTRTLYHPRVYAGSTRRSKQHHTQLAKYELRRTVRHHSCESDRLTLRYTHTNIYQGIYIYECKPRRIASEKTPVSRVVTTRLALSRERQPHSVRRWVGLKGYDPIGHSPKGGSSAGGAFRWEIYTRDIQAEECTQAKSTLLTATACNYYHYGTHPRKTREIYHHFRHNKK